MESSFALQDKSYALHDLTLLTARASCWLVLFILADGRPLEAHLSGAISQQGMEP
jgi:hypothetical protein